MSVDLDREIDLAVQAMLDAEPPPALRARVVAALQADRPRRAWVRWAIPAAVAAAVVVAVIVPTRSPNRVQPNVARGEDARLPAPDGREAGPPAPVTTRLPVSPAGRMPQSRGRVHAEAAGLPGAAIDALDGPSPLSIETIVSPGSADLPSIQPAPLRVRALDLPALELPPDAARGEDR